MPPKAKKPAPKAKTPVQKGKKRKRADSDIDYEEAVAQAKQQKKRNYPKDSFRFLKDKVPEEKLRSAVYHIMTEKTENFQCYKDICSLLKDPHIPAAIPYCYTRTQYEARNCLLTQDWTNFARLLFLMIENEKQVSVYQNATFKFFLQALLHDPDVKDKDYLEAFLSSVFDCNTTNEVKNFLREVSTLKKMECFREATKTTSFHETVKLPTINIDKVNLSHSKNLRKLFLGQKRKVPNLHKKSAKKLYKKGPARTRITKK